MTEKIVKFVICIACLVLLVTIGYLAKKIADKRQPPIKKELKLLDNEWADNWYRASYLHNLILDKQQELTTLPTDSTAYLFLTIEIEKMKTERAECLAKCQKITEKRNKINSKILDNSQQT
jgi:hypothetical protein